MATMIPENVEQFTTEGERQTYHFLEAVAKPDNRFVCWYLPDVQGKEPDFLLFSGKTGLVVLEVKDWNLIEVKSSTRVKDEYLTDVAVQVPVSPLIRPRHSARTYCAIS